jgi:integrase
VRALSQKRDAVLLETLYFTGCRIGEAQALRWSDMALDAKAPYFRLVDTKTRNTVELPLPRQVVTLLRSWQKEGPPTPFVFPAVSRAGELVSATYPGKVITAHRKASGIQWSPHDLRRTYISAAELAGVPSIVVRRLTNHAINSSDAHEGYAVAHVEDLAPWSQKVANRLQRWANQPGMVVELKTGTAYGN